MGSENEIEHWHKGVSHYTCSGATIYLDLNFKNQIISKRSRLQVLRVKSLFTANQRDPGSGTGLAGTGKFL